VRGKKGPSNVFQHVQPKPSKKKWMDRTQKPTPSFWQECLANQKYWLQGRSRWGLVQWVLRTRDAKWQETASISLQKRLLLGPDPLQVQGVIYALVFHKQRFVYIGQTVNSVWHRWKQHVHAKWKTDSFERCLQNELQKSSAADVSIIPLEVIPMPGTERQGHHTAEFIEEFRRRALAREQQWIRAMKGADARLLNVVREAAKTRTERRRYRRSLQQDDPGGKTRNKPPHNRQGTESRGSRDSPPERSARKWISVTSDWIVLDSTTPGANQRLRRSLAQLLKDQEDGKDPLLRIGNWSKQYRREVILFLMDQLDEKEVNLERSRVLFKFLATAENATARQAPEPSQWPDIDTAPQRQAKRDAAKEAIWLRIPWSRHDFKQLKLERLLHTTESCQAHPVPHAIKSTRISYSLNRPLSLALSNFTKACADTKGAPLQPRPEPAACPCLRFKTEHSLLFHGHVISTDPAAFKDDSLRQLWQCGRKFRVPGHPSAMLPDVKKGLAEYAERLSRAHKIDVGAFDAWIGLICHHVEVAAAAVPESDWLTSGYLTQAGYRELKAVQRDMVIGPTDKSAHDFMLVCKHAYLHALHEELMSGVYMQTGLTDDQIWDNHVSLATQLGCIPIKAHSYLYGAAKMHKDPASMRWIAGCTRQLVCKSGNREHFSAATSITPVASALGGILRFCMTQLERKDAQMYRPKGIKRYWIVTSVDAVAKHIKAHQKDLAQEQVYTEDFTTMYTKLPPDKIKEGVAKAVREAFQFYAPDSAAAFSLKWTNAGDAEAVFDDKGTYTVDNVTTWIGAVVDGTFLKASPESPTLHQVIGVPMGGKCSSELANLYCYSVESQVIDDLLSKNQLPLVKSMYNTFRYIDDILGFGNNQLHLFPYGMEHRCTNDSPHSAVFLGMSINTKGDFVQLRLHPKGAGWKWVPQRYVEWTSTHTSYTKKNLLKGLVVRAAVITNTMAAFHEAVEYYVQGLHARGFPKKALHHSFQGYLQDHWTAYPHLQQELSKWFKEMVGRYYPQAKGAPIPPRPQPESSAVLPARTDAQGSLLCGLRALNHVMVHLGRMPVNRDILDDVADNVAALEAMVSTESAVALPHAEGNYHVTAMSVALKQLADLYVKVWSPSMPPSAADFAYILGNGNHWQALLKEANGWYVRDTKSFKVDNLSNYLTMAARRGMVLTLQKEPPDSGDMDWDMEPPCRKRPLEALAEPANPEVLQIAMAANAEPTDVDEPEGKKTRCVQALEDSTQETLLQIKEEDYSPLPSDPIDRATRASTSAPLDPLWEEKVVGQTTLLYSPITGMYMCPRCRKFQRDTPLGVTSHYGKYCSKRPTEVAPEEQIHIDE
jgi:hypothetical protein